MKIITLNSGGADSLVAIKRLYDQGFDQHSIFVDVGQPNRERAKESAKCIAEKYCVSHEVLTLSSDSRNTFSTSNQLKVNWLKERVPFTDLLFPVICANLCVCEGVTTISLGGYRPVEKSHTPLIHHQRIDYLLNNTTIGEKVKILQPLSNIGNFKQLLDAGIAHGLTIEDFNKTVSCNSEEPCGECVKCNLRTKNGIKAN